ncbi:MAG TPA: choice-of-anchor Q domain-containing protein [Actinomycetota bacterium]|nr:choice-of-anchor Q domain-containing protein [Actinomycetota bacterium]
MKLSAGLFLFAAFLGVSVLVPVTPAGAAVIRVNTTTDDYVDNALCSLREAVIAANTNLAFQGCAGGGTELDVISLAPNATYDLMRTGPGLDETWGDLDIQDDGGPLRIEGGPGTVIDAHGTATNSRVLEVRENSEGEGVEDVTLASLTLTDGNDTSGTGGGGILVVGGSLTLEGSVVTGNTTTGRGGGIYNESGGDLILDGSLVSDNEAGGEGGGISNGGEATVVGSTIEGNTAAGRRGGGIDNFRALEVQRTIVRGNTGSHGAGVYSNGSLAMSGSLISENNTSPASGDGGGIYIQGSPPTVTGTTIHRNRGEHGDGMYIETNNAEVAGTTLLSNVTITGHELEITGQGGGLHVATGKVEMSNLTFALNRASASGGSGGHLYVGADTTMTVRNVAMDQALAGSNCGGLGIGTMTLEGTNLEEQVAGCGFTPVADLMLGPLADNGGPGLLGGGAPPTHALDPGSPALNSGADCEPSDQRGVPRPQGGGCDVGAYERAFCAGVLVNVVGTSGPDVLRGTEGVDGILALGGNDRVRGGGGNDGICGGPGRDRLIGGGGADRLLGGGGNDVLKGGPGKDFLSGGPGRDTCNGGPGRDRAVSCERSRGIP